MVRQAGVRELTGLLVNLDTGCGKALWRSRDNLAVTYWEERTYIEGTQVKVVGLIRGAQGGRRTMTSSPAASLAPHWSVR